MSAPAIGLVHPPLQAFPSGGNIYDAQLLAQSRRTASPWISVCWPASDLVNLRCDVLLWDSLLLRQAQRQGAERVGLLMHYLPSWQAVGHEQSSMYAMEERALARADFVIATGVWLREVVQRRRPEMPVFVCEPGVDSAFRPCCSPPPAGPVALLTVANLLPAKGHAALFALLERLRDLPWRWHVVGADDPRLGTAALLRSGAERAGLADRVVFHGPLDQARVAALMAECDLLLHPSRAESYGMVLAEAAACGLPVLSFRIGAAPQLIRHGENGLLVQAEDWEAFGVHLQRLLSAPALCATLARAARIPVRRWNETFAEVQAAIETMLQ
jgi:glycosyltransferase involved in cell wall biosynthesis